MTTGPRLTIIGGGSAQWVPILVEDFANTPCLSEMTLVLEDRDEARLGPTGAHARHVAEIERLDWHVVTTTDEAAALDGSDYVVVCVLTGGFDSMGADLDVARGYQVPMPVGTYLYGRRMYATVAVWETDPTHAEQSPVTRDFTELWRAAAKVVYLKTLQSVATARTRIEREFQPDHIRQQKASAHHDLVIAGPDLAAHALRVQLVDEFQRHCCIEPSRRHSDRCHASDGRCVPPEIRRLVRFAHTSGHAGSLRRVPFCVQRNSAPAVLAAQVAGAGLAALEV